MAACWVVWDEDQGGWWSSPAAPFLVPSSTDLATRSLMRAGLYTEERAQAIMAEANRNRAPGEWRVWALPDPLGRTV